MALNWFCVWKKGGGLIHEGVLYAGFYGNMSKVREVKFLEMLERGLGS